VFAAISYDPFVAAAVARATTMRISGILGNLLAHFLWRLSTENVGRVHFFFLAFFMSVLFPGA